MYSIKLLTIILSFTSAFVPQLVPPNKLYKSYTNKPIMNEENNYDSSQTKRYFKNKNYKYDKYYRLKKNHELYAEYLAKRRELYRKKFIRKDISEYNRSEETDN